MITEVSTQIIMSYFKVVKYCINDAKYYSYYKEKYNKAHEVKFNDKKLFKKEVEKTVKEVIEDLEPQFNKLINNSEETLHSLYDIFPDNFDAAFLSKVDKNIQEIKQYCKKVSMNEWEYYELCRVLIMKYICYINYLEDVKEGKTFIETVLKEYNNILDKEIDYIIDKLCITNKTQILLLKFYYSINVNRKDNKYHVFPFYNMVDWIEYTTDMYSTVLYLKPNKTISAIKYTSEKRNRKYQTEKLLNKRVIQYRKQLKKINNEKLMKNHNDLLYILNDFFEKQDPYKNRYDNILNKIDKNLGKDIKEKVKDLTDLSDVIQNEYSHKEIIEKEITNAFENIFIPKILLPEQEKYVDVVNENDYIYNKHYFTTYQINCHKIQSDFIKDNCRWFYKQDLLFNDTTAIILDLLYAILGDVLFRDLNETALCVLDNILKKEKDYSYYFGEEIINFISNEDWKEYNINIWNKYKDKINDTALKEIFITIKEKIKNGEIDIEKDFEIIRKNEEIQKYEDDMIKKINTYVKELKVNYNKIWNAGLF